MQCKHVGEKITKASFDEHHCIKLGFENGSEIEISDNTSCCEKRYMTTSDSISFLVGKTLLAVRIEVGPTIDNPDSVSDVFGTGAVHEVAFLRIDTDAGGVTFESHNEHNGYYGGFNLMIEEI